MKVVTLAAALFLLAGCPQDDKPKGSGTFKELRAHLATKSIPIAGRWQAVEARITALTAAGQAERARAAIQECGQILSEWQTGLNGAPSPLPIKAPLSTLRKSLDGLVAVTDPGAGREKALDVVEAAVQDLVRRKVEVVPRMGEPLAGADYLTRIWRDVSDMQSLGPPPRPGPDGAPPAEEDALASLTTAAREAQSGAGSPAERLAHGYAVQLLATADAYRKNPPKIDQRTALMFQMGRIGREQIDAAICAAAKPLAARVRAVEKLADQVDAACAKPGACSPAAADLTRHPMLRELKAVGAKAAQCAVPPPDPSPEGAPAGPGQAAPGSGPRGAGGPALGAMRQRLLRGGARLRGPARPPGAARPTPTPAPEGRNPGAP